jgi:hypothetical protein
MWNDSKHGREIRCSYIDGDCIYQNDRPFEPDEQFGGWHDHIQQDESINNTGYPDQYWGRALIAICSHNFPSRKNEQSAQCHDRQGGRSRKPPCFLISYFLRENQSAEHLHYTREVMIPSFTIASNSVTISGSNKIPACCCKNLIVSPMEIFFR